MIEHKEVVVNTGKYKGYVGLFICWTEPHKLSSEKRAQIRLQTGLGWVTLLINESNFKYK